MSCSTGKNGYYSEDEVREALIRSHIRFVKAASSYYKCLDCGDYHLTSRGSLHPMLEDPEVQRRIQQERHVQEWEGRFKR